MHFDQKCNPVLNIALREDEPNSLRNLPRSHGSRLAALMLIAVGNGQINY